MEPCSTRSQPPAPMSARRWTTPEQEAPEQEAPASATSCAGELSPLRDLRVPATQAYLFDRPGPVAG